MKIDIFYNPVYPKTRITIDNHPIDEADIYGFLYPVRNYILQTWLPESGSWHGIANELLDMTRGEKAKIVFHGRKIDYDDFLQYVRNVPITTTELNDTDYISIFQKRLDQAEKLTKEILETPVIMEQDDTPVKRSFKELYPNEYACSVAVFSEKSSKWLANIENKGDVGKNIGKSTCCFINSDSLLSSNDYTIIDQLTASLARAYDMIICCFHSEEMRECFRQYNEQLEKYNIRIVSTEDRNWESTLKEKYGIPYELRQRLIHFRKAYGIIQQCANEIHTVLNSDKLTPVSIRSELKIKYKKRWCSHQKNNINELRKLLFETDYMEQ